MALERERDRGRGMAAEGEELEEGVREARVEGGSWLLAAAAAAIAATELDVDDALLCC